MTTNSAAVIAVYACFGPSCVFTLLMQRLPYLRIYFFQSSELYSLTTLDAISKPFMGLF